MQDEHDLKENQKMKHLIIVPKSTLSNWKNEFRNWCPSIRLLVLYNEDKETRSQIASSLNQNKAFDAALTT